MIRLRVVAHEYFLSDYREKTFNEKYFPVGAVCECNDDNVKSPYANITQTLAQNTFIAKTPTSAIVFAPVSEHDQ